MRAGRIEQIGTPTDIYERPATRFVAGFIGTANMIEDTDGVTVIRPERLRLSSAEHAPPGTRHWPVRVEHVVYIGPRLELRLRRHRRDAASGRDGERRYRRLVSRRYRNRLVPSRGRMGYTHAMTGVRAAVTEQPGRIRVHEFPLPEPEPGAVVMKLRYSGICGTDKHTFRGESKQYAGTPHERDLTYPLICGHENVGEVVAIGGRVLDSEGRALKVGDRIVPGANVACGDCHFCRNGYPYYMCEHMEDYGNSLHCGRAPHPVRRLGGVHVPAAQHADLPRPGRPAGRGRGADRDHGGDARRRDGAGAARPDRRLSLRQFGRGAWHGPAWAVPPDQGEAARRGELIATDLFPSRLALARDFGASPDDARGRTPNRRSASRGRSSTRAGSAPTSCSIAAAFPRPSSRRCAWCGPGGVVVEAGTFVDMGPVGINPNSDICTRNVSVIGVGGETATSYLPAMRLMAANLRPPAVRPHRDPSHAAGTRAGGGGAGADRRGDEGRHGAERMRLKVGVIGCGLIAQVMHLHYLRELAEQFEIAALCDVSAAVCEACAGDYGVARTCTDWRELLAMDVDARAGADVRQPCAHCDRRGRSRKACAGREADVLLGGRRAGDDRGG